MFKAVAKTLLDRVGIESVRRSTLHRFINTRAIDLVVDVGANLGQFAQGMRTRGYRGPIHSFEPVSTVYTPLAAKAARDPQWRTTRSAVGAAAGEAEIQIYRNHTLSSLHPIDAGGAATIGVDPTVVMTETIPVTTLDTALAGDRSSAIFLKIDTQGHERSVLDGAARTLEHTIGLLLELPVEHLYQGIWSFNDAIAHLDALGFVPAQFRVVNTMIDDPASAMEFDCLFRRKR